VPALRQHIELCNQQSEIRVEFVAVGLENRRLPPAVETALYRIIQETLTNAARHARPTRVGVIVERRAGHVIAVIEDDGVGFDPEVALHRGRLGLVGMRERAEALGGSLKIESGLGTGTTVFVQIPVEGQPYSMARFSEHMHGHQLTETDRATGEVPYGKDSKSDCTAEH